jgi:hypothetical protein
METGRAPCAKSLNVDKFVAVKAPICRKFQSTSTGGLQQIHQESFKSNKIP